MAGPGGVLVGRGYVVIRPEFQGDWDRRVSNQTSRSGAVGGREFARAFSRGAGAALSGLGTIVKASLVGSGVSALAVGVQQIAAAAAVAAPALSALGTAGAAVGVGLKGVPDAFKAFGSAAADAKAAASATKQVESAQRALAKAQANVADARTAAARRVRDAEQSLAEAQRDALNVQKDLTDARKEATRQLEDLNQRLADSALDQRDAAIQVREAEQDLAKARKSGDQLAIDKAQLAADKATQNAEEQAVTYKRLQEDAAAANKAGVEGSDQVVAAKERITQANRKVSDAEQGLKDAQVDGAKQVKDAQEAVAEAARALADAQSAAASTVSKVDQAMAKLTPSAREFVSTVKELGPAWGEVRKATQEALFKDVASSFRSMSTQIIPDLKDGLAGAAGQVNALWRNWMRGVEELSRDGTLKKFFDSNTKILGNFARLPEQATRGWVQLSVAATPAFDRMTSGLAGASDRLAARMDKAFASGAMEESISKAVDNLAKLKAPLGDLKTIFGNLFDAMSGPGQQALGVVGQVLDQLARITSKPEIKEALTSIFTSFGQITETVLTSLAPLIERGLPMLAKGLEWVAQWLPPVVEWLGKFASVAIDKIGAGISASAQGAREFFDAFQSGAAGGAISEQASGLAQFGAATRGFTDKAAESVSAFFDAFRNGNEAGLWFTSSSDVSAVFDRMGVAARSAADSVGVLLPAIKSVGGVLQDGLLPVLESVGQLLISSYQHTFERIASVFDRFIRPTFQAIGDLIVQRIAPGLTMLGDKVSGLLDALAPFISVLESVVTFFVKIGASVLGFLVPALIRLAGPVVGFLFDALGVLVEGLTWVFRGISMLVEGAMWLWRVLQPVFEIIGIAARILAAVILTVLIAPVVIAFNILADVATWLWEVALKPVFDGIAAAAQWLWDNVLQPVVGFITDSMKGWGLIALWLYNEVIQPVASGIGSAVSGLWDNTLKPKIDAITDGFKQIGSWAEDAYNKVAEWFGKIGTKISEVLDSFKPAFDNAKKGVDEVWGGIQEIAAAPVRYIVNTVYTDGIRKVWNFVINAVGLGSLALPEAKFAEGGVLPGYAPGVDSVHAMLSPGEGVLVPEAVRALGPSWVYATNAYYSRGRATGGGNRYAAGGIVGHGAGMPMGGNNPFDPRDWGDIAGNVVDWAKRGLGEAYNGLKQVPGIGDVIQWAEKLVRGAAADAAEKLLRPVAGWAGDGIANAALGATHLGGATVDTGAPWVKALRDGPSKLIDKLVARIRKDDAEQQAAYGGVWLKPADGAYGASFGQAGPMWASGHHTGQDILAPFGSSVRAVADGIVADASSGGPYGNHILLNHTGGLQSLYAHLNQMLVTFGDMVAAGQQIGTVGMTGNTTGPHLHLEARSLSRGGAFNPMELLNANAGKAAPAGQVRDWIIQGLSVLGQGGNTKWINGLYTIAMRESGGDPRAINLWDSNARAGTPSKGLLQFIDPTFRAYAMPPYLDIWNPVDQVIADWFYIHSRYGDIGNVQQADPTKKPKGYAYGGIVGSGTHDVGGVLRHGELGLNLSGKPEAVLTAAQWDTSEKALAVATNRANGLPDGERLYLVLEDGTSLAAHVERRIAGAGVG